MSTPPPILPGDAKSEVSLVDMERLGDPARIARSAIELALLELSSAPVSFPRQQVLEIIQQAIGALYIALDARPEDPAHVEALSEAAARAADARSLLMPGGQIPALLARPIGVLEDARKLLVSRADDLAEKSLDYLVNSKRFKQGVPLETSSEFRTSHGVPNLHVLRRARVMPPLPPFVPPPPMLDPPRKPAFSPPKTLGELAAFSESVASGDFAKTIEHGLEEPRPAPPPIPIVYAYDPGVEEREALRMLARDAIEDIANLSNLRKPIPTETWLDQGPFEQRLLDNLDYFASLGETAIRLVHVYHHEAKIPDPMRAFAVAFTMGCIEGRDTIGAAISALKQSAPEEWPGFVEALVLAPHPAIDDALAEVLAHPNVGLVGVALDVLGARGTFPEGVLEWVGERNDPSLTIKLASGLACSLSDDVAQPALAKMLERTRDDDLWITAARSSLARGFPSVRDRLREAIGDSSSPKRAAAAAELLAITGVSDDLDRLVDAAKRFPAPRVLRALGRFGHVQLVPVLIELLAIGDEIAEGAAEALDRITAAGLREIVEEAWDVGIPEDLRSEAARVGAPIPKRKMNKVIVDPKEWQTWAQHSLASLDARLKHRAGRPFRPSHVIDELEAKETPPARRDDAAFELSCMMGVRLRFSTRDWVVRQQQHLVALRERCLALEGPEGAWWYVRRATSSESKRHRGRTVREPA